MIASIQQTILTVFEDDDDALKVSSIGSVLMVLASEKTHLKVEVLLAEVFESAGVAVTSEDADVPGTGATCGDGN